MGKLYHLRMGKQCLGLQCDVVERFETPGQRGQFTFRQCGGEAWYSHDLPSGGTQRLCKRHAGDHPIEEGS